MDRGGREGCEEESGLDRFTSAVLVPVVRPPVRGWSKIGIDDRMGAVDKVALGTAAVLGIRGDLGLKGQQFSWCSSLIFFGQLVSVFPALYVGLSFVSIVTAHCLKYSIVWDTDNS